jgi:hypothetical protein
MSQKLARLRHVRIHQYLLLPRKLHKFQEINYNKERYYLTNFSSAFDFKVVRVMKDIVRVQIILTFDHEW